MTLIPQSISVLPLCTYTGFLPFFTYMNQFPASISSSQMSLIKLLTKWRPCRAPIKCTIKRQMSLVFVYAGLFASVFILYGWQSSSSHHWCPAVVHGSNGDGKRLSRCLCQSRQGSLLTAANRLSEIGTHAYPHTPSHAKNALTQTLTCPPLPFTPPPPLFGQSKSSTP